MNKYDRKRKAANLMKAAFPAEKTTDKNGIKKHGIETHLTCKK
jgi:hypothetical protein